MEEQQNNNGGIGENPSWDLSSSLLKVIENLLIMVADETNPDRQNKLLSAATIRLWAKLTEEEQKEASRFMKLANENIKTYLEAGKHPQATMGRPSFSFIAKELKVLMFEWERFIHSCIDNHKLFQLNKKESSVEQWRYTI